MSIFLFILLLESIPHAHLTIRGFEAAGHTADLFIFNLSLLGIELNQSGLELCRSLIVVVKSVGNRSKKYRVQSVRLSVSTG